LFRFLLTGAGKLKIPGYSGKAYPKKSFGKESLPNSTSMEMLDGCFQSFLLDG